MYLFGKQWREWAKSPLSSRKKPARSFEPEKYPAFTIPLIIFTAIYQIGSDRTLCLPACSGLRFIAGRIRKNRIQTAGFQLRCDEQGQRKPAVAMEPFRWGGLIAVCAALLLFPVLPQNVWVAEAAEASKEAASPQLVG
ncbi:MAG: hypothetical protein ACP5E2_14285 [Terracidiphilus sp.]